MEEIYYVDRPSIPAECQNIIHLDAIVEHAILIAADDINPTYAAHAVEVRNSAGAIEGTLLYFSSVTHAQLTTPQMTEDEMDEIASDTADSVEPTYTPMHTVPSEEDFIAFDGEPVDNVVCGLCDEDRHLSIDEFNRESELIDLDLALAEATQHVQEIRDKIANLEKEALID